MKVETYANASRVGAHYNTVDPLFDKLANASHRVLPPPPPTPAAAKAGSNHHGQVKDPLPRNLDRRAKKRTTSIITRSAICADVSSPYTAKLGPVGSEYITPARE
jgi:hypothetical protein